MGLFLRSLADLPFLPAGLVAGGGADHVTVIGAEHVVRLAQPVTGRGTDFGPELAADPFRVRFVGRPAVPVMGVVPVAAVLGRVGHA